MTPADLVAWLRQYAGSDYHSSGSRNQLFQAADLIERAYPGPNTPGERRMGFTDDPPLLLPSEPPPGHVRVRIAVAADARGNTCSYTGPDVEAMAEAEAGVFDVTHRCFAIVDVPPCVPVPEVPAAVEEVAP